MASAVVPAWKRLGLKLKANQSLSQTGTASPHPLKKKRKIDEHENTSTSTEEANTFSDRKLPSAVDGDEAKSKGPKKKVSFSSDTKKNAQTPNSSIPQLHPTDTVGHKKPKSKSRLAKHQPLVKKSTPALEYLNQYYTARSSWKFNKNREIWLLKHIFSVADVPREYEIPLAKYIHGLQGNNARQRLKAESEKQFKEEADSANYGISHREDSKKDEEYRLRFLRELEDQESASSLEGVNDRDEYHGWIQRQPRAGILLWALGSSLPTCTTDLEVLSASNPKGKKRKNRTTVIEYDSSSSSESDSDSDSGDGSTSSTSSGEESSTS